MKNTNNIDLERIGKAYLEFLRNLTPIILFLSVGLYFCNDLQFFTFNLDNWKNTLIAFFCLIVAFFAIVINFYNFTEILIRKLSKRIDKRIRRFKKQKNRNLTIKESFIISWKILLVSLILAIFIMLFLYFIAYNALISEHKMLCN